MISHAVGILALAMMCASPLVGQDTAYVSGAATAWDGDWQQIPGPKCLEMRGAWEGGSTKCSPQEHEQWLADVTHWRDERRIRIGYDPARYEMPELKWTQSSFIQPQMMVQDRYFYDPVAGKYTVDRYLDDLRKALWRHRRGADLATYPNMGIDNRNQHDMIRCMPGGVAGVRADGRGLSSARRARTLSHDDVGPGHARSRPSPGLKRSPNS